MTKDQLEKAHEVLKKAQEGKPLNKRKQRLEADIKRWSNDFGEDKEPLSKLQKKWLTEALLKYKWVDKCWYKWFYDDMNYLTFTGFLVKWAAVLTVVVLVLEVFNGN